MILFSDFDRTFYFRDDRKKNRANFEAIRKWRDAGHQFCVTTGRSYKSVSRQLPQIEEICDYYIVDNGSIILSKSGKLLKAFYFRPEVVVGIVEFAKNFPEVPVAFYYTNDSEGVEYRDNNVTKLRLWFKDLDLLDNAVLQLEGSFPVLAFMNKDAVSVHKELDGRNGFVEIIPLGYGKSNAIKVLQEMMNIPMKDVVTVGDGLNDYGMIRDFEGFAIKDSELIREHSGLKTVSSVASLVERLMLD